MCYNGPAMKRWGIKPGIPSKCRVAKAVILFLTFLFKKQISDLAVIAFAATSQTAPNPQCFMSHCCSALFI
jgi:hypothetical protein